MKGHYLQKIKNDFREASSTIEEWKVSGKKIVFTNGCFDILHSGHIQYLDEARSLGDFLVIGINDDDSVSRLKGALRPILQLEERMNILSGLAMVDLVIPFTEDTPLSLIEFIQPDILVKGGDYQIHEIVGAEHVLRSKGEVKVLSFKEGPSTSNVIETIVNRYSNEQTK